MKQTSLISQAGGKQSIPKSIKDLTLLDNFNNNLMKLFKEF